MNINYSDNPNDLFSAFVRKNADLFQKWEQMTEAEAAREFILSQFWMRQSQLAVSETRKQIPGGETTRFFRSIAPQTLPHDCFDRDAYARIRATVARYATETDGSLAQTVRFLQSL